MDAGSSLCRLKNGNGKLSYLRGQKEYRPIDWWSSVVRDLSQAPRSTQLQLYRDSVSNWTGVQLDNSRF
jgi:hypothetical protein